MMKKLKVLISALLTVSMVIGISFSCFASVHQYSQEEVITLDFKEIHDKFLRKPDSASARSAAAKEKISLFDYFNPDLKDKGYEVFGDFAENNSQISEKTIVNARKAEYNVNVARIGTVAQVGNQAELVAAIENSSVDTIEIENSFTLTDSIAIPRDIDFTVPSGVTDDVTITSAPGKRHFTIIEEPDITVTFNKVILDGNNVGGGIEILRSYVTIEDAHIINCYTTDTYGGGAIHAYNQWYDEDANEYVEAGLVYLIGGTFVNNSTIRSGGAISSYGALDIDGATIKDNTAALSAGGVLICNFTLYNVLSFISNTTIEGNSAGSIGGGIALFGLTSYINDGSVIKGNDAEAGGGLAAISCVTNIDDSFIESNYIETEEEDPGILHLGGAGILATGRLILTDTSVINNISDFYVGAGTGILMLSAEISGTVLSGRQMLSITRGTISGNANRYMVDGVEEYAFFHGGGVAAFDVVVRISSAVLNNNHAHYGGAISITGEQLTVSNCTMNGNVGEAYGSAIYCTDFYDWTTDLYEYEENFTSPTVSITGSTISNGTSLVGGGGIFVCNDDIEYDEDGEIVFQTELDISNTDITGNSAALGGGIGVINVEVTLDNATTVKQNIADGENLTFIHPDDLGLSGAGGGMMIDASCLNVKECEISGNTAIRMDSYVPDPGSSAINPKYSIGGGICGTEISSINISDEDALIAGNTADYGGGIFSADELTITGGTIGGILDAENTPENADEPVMLADGNTALCKGGGIYSTNVMNVTNGSISYNISVEQGGGIYGKDINFIAGGDPTVSYNKAIGKELGTGGGVFIADGGIFYFDSGTIHDNGAYMYAEDTETYIGYGGYDYEGSGHITSHDRNRIRNFSLYIYNNFPEDFYDIL